MDNFTGLCPLEPPPASPLHKSSTFAFGYVTTVYKAVNIKTGQHMYPNKILVLVLVKLNGDQFSTMHMVLPSLKVE